MSDLDEVLERDSDGKINWLVSKVNDIDTRVHTIETNHLFHMEKDMAMLRRGVYLSMSNVPSSGPIKVAAKRDNRFNFHGTGRFLKIGLVGVHEVLGEE